MGRADSDHGLRYRRHLVSSRAQREGPRGQFGPRTPRDTLEHPRHLVPLTISALWPGDGELPLGHEPTYQPEAEPPSGTLLAALRLRQTSPQGLVEGQRGLWGQGQLSLCLLV